MFGGFKTRDFIFRRNIFMFSQSNYQMARLDNHFIHNNKNIMQNFSHFTLLLIAIAKNFSLKRFFDNVLHIYFLLVI
jgi:hypothetical protein